MTNRIKQWLASLRARQLAAFVSLVVPLLVISIYAYGISTSIQSPHGVRDDYVPGVILYMQSQERLSNMNSSLLDYLSGASDEVTDFKATADILRSNFEQLERLETSDIEVERLQQIEQLFDDFFTGTQRDVFDVYSPRRESDAITAANNLENTVGRELNEALDAYSVREYQDALRATDLQTTVKDDLPGVFMYMQTSNYVGDILTSIGEYVSGEVEERESFVASCRRFDRVLADLSAIEQEPHEQAAIKQLRDLKGQVKTQAEAIFESYDPTKKKDALQAADRLERQTLANLVGKLKVAANEEITDITVEVDKLDKSLATMRKTLLPITALCSALGIGLFVFTTLGIARSFNNAVQTANSIALGDLDQEIRVQGPTEFKELAKSLVEMTTRLKKQGEESDARLRAEAANLAKSRFLANMSHEIRTPMNAILGFAHLLRRNRELDDRQREQVSGILSSGDHLLTLINDVLELSKIEAGRIYANESTFSLCEVIQRIESMFRQRAEQKGIEFEISVGETVPAHIVSDRAKLRQILINLVGNAIKFTKSGSVRIHVRLDDRNQPPRIHFEVDDTGPGIAPEDRDAVFATFEQRGDLIQAAQGTGLGLAISREYAHLLNSTLTIEDKAPPGSKFRLSIPMVVGVVDDFSESPEISSNDIRLSLALPDGRSRPRILIVDDNALNRNLLVQMLESEPLSLDVACDGVEAVEACERQLPNLILMDIRMPRMDGFTAMKHIRKLPGAEGTKIVTVTASAFEEDRFVSESAGADGYIRKPVTDCDLLQTVAKMLSLDVVTETLGVPQNIELIVTDSQRTRLLDAISRLARANVLEVLSEIETDSGASTQHWRMMAERFSFQGIEAELHRQVAAGNEAAKRARGGI